MLGGLGFENAYSLAMRRERAEALGIRSIADLAAHARNLSIGGDYEFFIRPEWDAIRDTYGLAFASSGRCSRSSCIRPRHRAMSTSSPPTPATAVSRSSTCSCWTIPSAPSRPTTRSCCCRRDAPRDPGAYRARCAARRRSVSSACVRRTCVRPAAATPRPRRPRVGCGTDRPEVARGRGSRCTFGAPARFRTAEHAPRTCRRRRSKPPCRRPAGAARQRAKRFGRILVAVLGVDGLAGAEIDGRRRDRNALPLEAGQVHFDARALAVEEGMVLERARSKSRRARG
jgi:hypothetical protein